MQMISVHSNISLKKKGPRGPFYLFLFFLRSDAGTKEQQKNEEKIEKKKEKKKRNRWPDDRRLTSTARRLPSPPLAFNTFRPVGEWPINSSRTCRRKKKETRKKKQPFQAAALRWCRSRRRSVLPPSRGILCKNEHRCLKEWNIFWNTISVETCKKKGAASENGIGRGLRW